VNEGRVGYSRIFNSVGTLLAFQKDVVSEIGIPGQNGGDPVTWGIPNIGIAGGFSGIGDSNEGPYSIDDNTLQFFDKLSWVHGNHVFGLGFEYNRQNYNTLGNQFSRGLFEFEANATQSPPGANGKRTGGYAFADFLLGDLFQSTNAVAIANAKFQRNVEAAFVDDTWKLTPKLTLSLGLRWELTPPFHNTLGNLFNVNIPKLDYGVTPAPQADWPYYVRQAGCTDPYEGLAIHWTVTKAVCGGMGENLMQTHYNNFAPRLGISYALGNNTVIRTGFGMFYTQDIGNAVFFDLARTIGARVTLASDNGVPTLFWNNAIPGGSGAVAQIPPPYAYAAAYSHNSSYTMQYLLNIQRQIGQSWMVEAGYLGSSSRHLYGFQDANQAVPIKPGETSSSQNRRPFPTFGTIQLVADGFNANYNAGSVKLTHRFSQASAMWGGIR
jgi:hypothetical protein